MRSERGGDGQVVKRGAYILGCFDLTPRKVLCLEDEAKKNSKFGNIECF